MWIGKVIPEERGTTEDLGCEPRCPNDTLAIKRRLATGDRRSQSVESRSHALLWDPYCGIGIKEDPVSIFNRFYLRIISTLEISLCTSSVLHSRMLIERLATISNICWKYIGWEIVCMVTCDTMWIWGCWKVGLSCISCARVARWILGIFILGVEITLEITEKLLRVDQVLFW